MYLQITTKCNMTCPHCCYSCTNKGRHMKWERVVDAIAHIREYGNESIVIGGGEPTLHPRFFDILKMCLEDFDYVWMATNGSQVDTMFRLADIIDGEDYPECDCMDRMTEKEYDNYGCLCHEQMDYDSIYQEDKLSVALSQDCFHDDIDQRIIDLWSRRANQHNRSHFEIRNVSNHVIAQGRAAKTGSGWIDDDCVCSDMIVKPSGKIRLCGCNNAPVIGDIWSGVSEKWEKVLNDDTFRDANCYNYWRKNK